MPIESAPQEKSFKQLIEERRDRERAFAEEGAKKVADIQTAKYEAALLRLLRRTDANPRIANALNAFIDALEAKSHFGASDKPLNGAKAEELGTFLAESAEKLQFDVQWGGRPASNIEQEWRKSWREEYHLESK